MQAQDLFRSLFRVIVLIVCWGLLIWLVYWAVTQEPTSATEEWDPYVILGLDKVTKNKYSCFFFICTPSSSSPSLLVSPPLECYCFRDQEEIPFPQYDSSS